ncbi:MAG: tetratricopeptide repeat protein [Pseudomonadota bacterium]
MTDLFEEVEEQLRSDRYKQLARKLLPWALGIVAVALVAFGAYWGWDEWRTRQSAQASETYSAAMDAFVAGDRQKSQQLWAEVSNSGSPAYKALALMHLGALQMEQNKPAEAVKLYDQAAEASPDPVIGDAARLKSALALLDTAPLSEMEGRLKPLMEEGRPFRTLAREALAFAKIRAGDLAGARGEFVLINQSLDAPQSMQQRAQAAIGLIDSGSAKAIAEVVKTAQALPPPMTVDPGAVIGAPQPQDGAPQ